MSDCASSHRGLLSCPSVQWVCPNCDARVSLMVMTPEEAKASHEHKCPMGPWVISVRPLVSPAT